MSSNTDLLRRVRTILAENPRRHDQDTWYGNFFEDGDWINDYRLSVEEARQWAAVPVPAEPMVPEATCGTTGCVAGWAAILAAPMGAVLTDGYFIVLPDQKEGEDSLAISFYAREALGISRMQAIWLFSSSRTHVEVLAELDYLIENPDDERDYWERFTERSEHV